MVLKWLFSKHNIKHVDKMNKCTMCQNCFTRFFVRCCL